MTIYDNIKINLNEEEKKRWNDAGAIMREIYDALPSRCRAEATILQSLNYFREFARNYMED